MQSAVSSQLYGLLTSCAELWSRQEPATAITSTFSAPPQRRVIEGQAIGAFPPDHIAAGYTTTDDARPMSISDVFTETSDRTNVQVTWGNHSKAENCRVWRQHSLTSVSVW